MGRIRSIGGRRGRHYLPRFLRRPARRRGKGRGSKHSRPDRDEDDIDYENDIDYVDDVGVDDDIVEESEDLDEDILGDENLDDEHILEEVDPGRESIVEEEILLGDSESSVKSEVTAGETPVDNYDLYDLYDDYED